MNHIRNFCIIAHIDHGKSTLADRFLEVTHTISKDKLSEQFLDKMSLEKERGITIKMHPVKMAWQENGESYIFNLIDTPGHVDFNYEVSRSLAAVEGAILLVDATQGIQAQTITNLDLALKQNLKIIPVLNKIDLAISDIESRRQELSELLAIEPEEILMVSAKKKTNIESLLSVIVSKIPSPKGEIDKPLKALVFDSKYDPYKGIIAYVRVFDGNIKADSQVYFMAQNKSIEVLEVGVFNPELIKVDSLSAGSIGWVATGLKDPTIVRVGDTITDKKDKQGQFLTEPLTGYAEPRPMVFAGFYPESADDYELFRDALLKLKLNDASLFYEPENSDVLGKGFRLGFLGMLHLEITRERLVREYRLKIITTLPLVPYKIYLKGQDPYIVISPADFPSSDKLEKVEEPFADLEIITPPQYLSNILKLLNQYRAVQITSKNIGLDKLALNYELPFTEILRDLYDNLKSASGGYASMSYQISGYRATQIEKVEILLANKTFESLSRLIPYERVESEARLLVKTLKEILPQQNYQVAIQAKGFGRIIARETIGALKKDVTAHLYGGDRTRKMKLWKKQKKGKKRLLEQSDLHIDSEIFLKLLKTRS
ncbi:MAG: translation elongation factor 4 [Candidatus Parcubacteria bacterium]|nr:translation elongation factor 4 [Candidatus Parcubacteria bacterium]